MQKSDSRHPVNSREWWEDYFLYGWDANNGSSQTRHFMQCLIDNLPGPELLSLRSDSVSVLDWGCAFGEGVKLLKETFPQSEVVGMDFASSAVEEAQRR